jgi:undecaprenyl-diphosphatase
MLASELVKALILGIVEGLTEFLPVSSTGHLVAVGTFLNFAPAYAKTFEVIVQFGAIVAVCWEFRSRIASIVMTFPSHAPTRRFVVNVMIATIPAVVLALMFENAIKKRLFSPIPVAFALLFGGVIILLVERRVRRQRTDPSRGSLETISHATALKIGLLQCLALLPGTSRSGATIIGGMLVGLDRPVATEFSFFLAIPIISGATLYEIGKSIQGITTHAIEVMSVGLIAAFFSAFICVRWLLRYVASHDFTAFGWYRIGAGLLLLSWYLSR